MGRVESIWVAVSGGAVMEAAREVELVPGKGIVGDRYFAGLGSFSPEVQDPDHELTLIEAEETLRFNAEVGASFEPSAFRRNVVTRGVRLAELIGVEFQMGETRLRGIRLCEPCLHLARLVHPEVVSRLAHRAGIRAGIVSGGRLRPGDPVGG